MSDFLVFTLESRMASFGDLAGQERRGSEIWPGKSSLVGLLGAALGVQRSDDAAQARLSGLSVAVAAYDTGTPLRDYHTVESIAQKIRNPGTRANAIALARSNNGSNTSITWRDYRCGVLYGVVVWSDGEHDLKKIATALERPAFVPFLGRKSCPLSSPMAAKVVSRGNPLEALDALTLPPWRTGDDSDARISWLFIASDPHAGFVPEEIVWRHDVPVDRHRWHFKAREVHVTRGSR